MLTPMLYILLTFCLHFASQNVQQNVSKISHNDLQHAKKMFFVCDTFCLQNVKTPNDLFYLEKRKKHEFCNKKFLFLLFTKKEIKKTI